MVGVELVEEGEDGPAGVAVDYLDVVFEELGVDYVGGGFAVEGVEVFGGGGLGLLGGGGGAVYVEACGYADGFAGGLGVEDGGHGEFMASSCDGVVGLG